jgi:hypothetical protein
MGLLRAQDSEPPELCQPPAQRLNSPTDRCGVAAGPLEVPATLLACAEKVIEWGADCCGARVLRHFSDLPTHLTNVGYQGKSGSNSDIAKSTRMTVRPEGANYQ